jgi:hypothetical protein
MREFFITSYGVTGDWLIFLAMLALICLFVGVFVVWYTIFRHKGKKRRKRHHHHRHNQPKPLSAGGSLPPRRDEPHDLPPPAP